MKDKSLVFLAFNLLLCLAITLFLKAKSTHLRQLMGWAPLSNSDARTQYRAIIANILMGVLGFVVLFIFWPPDIGQEDCQSVGFPAFAFAG